MILEADVSCTAIQNNKNRKASIAKNLKSLCPASLDVIRYKKGESEGNIWNQDMYAVFDTSICIVNHTNAGRLRIVNFDMPESLTFYDVILPDPLCMNKMTTSARKADKVLFTIVM